jgi:hypothetical protein
MIPVGPVRPSLYLTYDWPEFRRELLDLSAHLVRPPHDNGRTRTYLQRSALTHLQDVIHQATYEN